MEARPNQKPRHELLVRMASLEGVHGRSQSQKEGGALRFLKVPFGQHPVGRTRQGTGRIGKTAGGSSGSIRKSKAYQPVGPAASRCGTIRPHGHLLRLRGRMFRERPLLFFMRACHCHCSTRRPWSRIELLPCLRQLPQVRTRRKAGDSRRAQFSSSGIGSLLCWGAAAWAKSIALRISSSGML